MIINKKQLMIKLDEYFANLLTKEEFGKWINQCYWERLHEKLTDIDFLYIYPYIQTLSTINIRANAWKEEYPCSDDSVKYIKDVLHGDINDTFVLQIQLNSRVHQTPEIVQPFIQLRNSLEINTANRTDFDDYLDAFTENNFPPNQVTNILDVLQIHFFGILGSTPSYNNGISRSMSYGIGVSYQTMEDRKCNGILKILDCIVGVAPFSVCVAYQSGIPTMSLLPYG